MAEDAERGSRRALSLTLQRQRSVQPHPLSLLATETLAVTADRSLPSSRPEKRATSWLLLPLAGTAGVTMLSPVPSETVWGSGQPMGSARRRPAFQWPLNKLCDLERVFSSI